MPAPATTSCSSRASFPHEPSSRLRASAAVRSSARRRIGSPPASASHSAGDGCRRNRWTSRARAERAQHLEVGRGQARQAEQADARRELDQPGLRAQPRARVRQPLGRRRHADPRAQPAPQLRLPVVVVLALGPAEHQLGPVRAVAVEQPGEMAHGGEAARAADGVVGAAEVGGEVARPRLLQRAGDHVEQRPDQPLGQPRVGLRIDARDGGDRVADQHRAGAGSRRWRRSRGRPRAAGSASAPSRAWGPRRPRRRTGPRADRRGWRAARAPARRRVRLGGCAACSSSRVAARPVSLTRR